MSVRNTLMLIVLTVIFSVGTSTSTPIAHRLPQPHVVVVRGTVPAKDDIQVTPTATQTVVPTSTPAQVPTTTPQPEATQYVVQPGDTVTALALRFGLTVQDVVDVNGLTDPDMLDVGQTLVMEVWNPAVAHDSALKLTPVYSGIRSHIAANYYVIQKGDTLASISIVVGESAEKIAAQNKLTNPDALYPGITLAVHPWYPEIPDSTRCDTYQILVVLRSQRLYAYDHCKMVREFVVSTGISSYPTVTGEYRTRDKLESTLMEGPDYYLPHVPWTQYFFKGYALHGKDWNTIYGRPSSHGCVNMRVEDAQWLFQWSYVGIYVLIVA